MENLKNKIETINLDELCNNLTQEFSQLSSSNYKIKLAFVLIHIIEQASKHLSLINCNDFITQIKERINDLESHATNLSKEYHTHLYQNNEICELLSDDSVNNLSNLQNNIDELLSQYDNIIKNLVELREKLPIEKQMELE